MDDKKSLRFTEEEKNVLFSLFMKYKDIIDIRHRRHSQSQHKQAALRKCWDSILNSFNEHPDTSKRSMKQIQKFWLNSKLRKRLPGEKEGSKSPEKSPKAKTLMQIKVERKTSSDAAYQELVKTCKDSENEDDEDEDEDRKMTMETTDEIELTETSTGNGEQYEEHYDTLGETYFQNDSITLKVINDQIDLALATPAPSSLVTIPATSQHTAAIISNQNFEPQIKKQNESSSPSSAAATTAYITYSPQSTSTLSNQNIQLVKSATGNYLITTPSNANSSQQQVLRNIRISQSSPVTTTTTSTKDMESMSLQELQKQEQLLRIREAKLRCEVQEMEKEKAREELLQMKEVHRMKIKEMETRLRNMERS